MFPGEGTSNYGIFSGLDALGQDAPVASMLASAIKSGAIQLKPASASSAQIFTGAPSVPGSPVVGGGIPLVPDVSAVGPGVTASGNSVIYIGLAVAALAIGGALYIKKRKKAA